GRHHRPALRHPGHPVRVWVVRQPDVPYPNGVRSEEHTSELQSRFDLVCRLLLEKKKKKKKINKIKNKQNQKQHNNNTTNTHNNNHSLIHGQHLLIYILSLTLSSHSYYPHIKAI